MGVGKRAIRRLLERLPVAVVVRRAEVEEAAEAGVEEEAQQFAEKLDHAQADEPSEGRVGAVGGKRDRFTGWKPV